MSGELMVRVVGGFTLSVAGRVLPTGRSGTRKARTLLALLAVHDGAVPIDGIVAALWDGDAPRNPRANVATLVSRLRAVHGRGIIGGVLAGYELGREVRVDLHEAARLTADAERHLAAGQPASALRAARAAIDLLDHGAVLADHPDAGWAEPARSLHTGLLRRGRTVAAEAAVIADGFDETACHLLMRAYHAAGEPAMALLAYERLRATLATELGVDPAPATRALHVTILQAA